MSQYSIFAKLGLDMKEFEAGVTEFQKQMRGMSREMQQASKEWAGLDKVGKQLSGIGESISKHVTLPLLAMGAGAAKAAVDFESAFAGVRKTVDASEADLARLSNGIRQMALDVPATAEEIAAVAEAAGQLGIKTENILSFTRTMVDLGVATNLTADQAATMLARFANVTGLPQEEFDRLGSTIVSLGNNFATTEAEIVEMGQRLAAAGSIAGLSAPEIMGFAAALTSVGINAEAGGSAFSKLFAEINTSVMSGGSQLEKFAQVAGQSADEFATAYRDNAAGAITTFIEGLKGIMDSGGNVYATLSELEVQEIRMLNAMLSTAGAGDLLADAIDNANRSFEENTALTKEAEQRYTTTASQMKLLWNGIKDLGYQFGEILLPVLNDVVDSLKGAVKWFSDLEDGTKKTILVVAGIAAAFGPVILAVGKLITAFTSIMSVIGSLKVALGALSVIFSPITLAVAAFAAVAVVVYRNWDEIGKWFSDTFPKAGDAFTRAVRAIGEAVSTLWEGLKRAFDYFTNAYDENVSRLGDLRRQVEESLGFRVDVEKAFQTSAQVVDNYLSALVDGVGSIFSIIGDLAKFFWSGFTGDWRGGWEAVQSIAETIWDAVVSGFARFNDSVLAIAEGMFGWIPGVGDKIAALRDMFGGMIPVEAVKKDMSELEAANIALIGKIDDQGIAWESSAGAAEKAAQEQAKQQESIRQEAEKTVKAIEGVADAYTKSMAKFDREIEIGVRVSDGADDRLRHEIESLTESLSKAASDVSIDIDSKPIMELRQRLQEAKGDLMGLQQSAAPASIAIRSMSSEIDHATESLSLMSKITGEAIAADTWRKAKDAVEDYGDAVGETTDETKGITDVLNNYMIPGMNVWVDRTKSVGEKFNGLAQIALSAIPGIGGALAGLLGVMDSVGMGLDDIGRKIAGLFSKGKVSDSGAAWFKEVNRLIKEFKEQGLSDMQIISDLKILFPNISEETLKALVEGTSEAFAEYNKWLADPKNKLMEGSEDMGKKLAEALASGLSDTAAIEKVLQELMKGIDPKSWSGATLEKAYTENLQKILAALKEFGIDHDDFFANLSDPADQAAIELESALIRIRETLEKNVDTISEKLKAGLITQEMADTSILKEYEKAIDDMFEAGLKADDPRVLDMIEAWKALGGGAKDAAEETGEATDDMAAAIKKQEKVYAETLASLAKLEQDNAAMIALGVKTQTDSQKELLRAYQKAIEDLVDAGLKPDDPRLVAMVDAWKAMGGSVEDATEKVKQTVTEQEKAAAKLQDIYEKLASDVATQLEKVRMSWESGATDGLTAMQQEAVLLRDAIESMLKDGMNGDDPRIAAWQERLAQINQNMKDLGLATYEVIEPTDKVGNAWRDAGDKLAETLEYIEKKNIAGLFTKEADALREQANAYKRAIEDFLKAGDPDDPRIQGWLEALRQINERLAETGEEVVDLRDKFEIAADAIREKLDEKLGNIEYDMKFNFDGADDDLDLQIEKTKAKMKALNDAIIAAGQAGFDKQDELVKGLVESYEELFDKLKDLEWQKTQEGVTDMFDATMAKLAELDVKYKLFGDTQDYLSEKMKLLKDAINKMIQEGIDPEDDRLLELSEQYKEAAKAAEMYAESQKQIKDAIKDAIGVGPDQDANNTLLMKLGEAALELWGRVDSLIRQTAGEAILWLSGWSSDVLSVFKRALEDSKAFREKVIAEQSAAMSNGLDLIKTAWGLAAREYDDFVKHVYEDLKTTLPAIHNTGIGFGSAIQTGMQSLIDGIGDVKDLMTGAVAGFSDAAKTEFELTLSYAQDLAQAMSEAFTSALSMMKDAIGDLATVTVTFAGGPSGGAGVPEMATGGIVPSGFPNDTYPALLTSGEMVIPKPYPLSNMAAGGGSVVNHITVVLDGERIQDYTTRGVVNTLRRAGIA